MRWVVGTSLRFRYLVVFAAIALLFFGTMQLRQLPVDVFPEFAPPRVEIQTSCLGLSAPEVESFVTIPLEEALNGLPHLDVIRSKSVPQLSSVELLFKQGTDLLRARQAVEERMATVVATLPTWAAPPVMMAPVSATSRVMKIGLSSRTISLLDLSTTAYWTIRARLLRVPGVANVAIWGERLQMLQVQVEPDRLLQNGVSLDAVMETTAGALDSGLLRFSGGTTIGKGGDVETPTQHLAVRHELPIIGPADLAEVSVGAKADGSPLLLRDVAQVVEDHQPLIGDAVVNGGPGLMMVVEKLPWASTVDVTRGVDAALDELEPGLPGVKIDATIFRATDFIDVAVHNLAIALLIGSLLVMFVLFAFLHSWRSALISVVAIPLSLVAALLVLSARGGTVNTMMLAGMVIAVGVVVDDAIIDIENVVRRLRQSRAEGLDKPLMAVVLDGSLEVRSAVVYATLIDVAALLPVLLMTGLSGSFFRPLALSYGLAVFASMLVALTVTPALGMILLSSGSLDPREPPLVRWAHTVYERLLRRVMRAPRTAFLSVLVLLIVGIAIAPWLGASLFPQFKERDLLMHFITKPGTSAQEEVRIVERVAREVKAVPGVRSFGSHIGQAFLADEIAGVNFGENWISIDPSADYGKTLAAIQRIVDGYPGLQRNVETYLNERIHEVLTGSSSAIVVRIFGPDLIGLRRTAKAVKRQLSEIRGITDEQLQLVEDVPQVEVTVDLARAAAYGLKPGDIRRAAAVIVSGEEVGDIFRDGKAYDVQVWSTPESRSSLTDVQNLLIDTPDGGHVRLADVASVEVTPAPNVVYRQAASRSIDVGADVSGRSLGAVVRDVADRLAKVHYPLGYHAELLGENAERQASTRRLLSFAIGAAIAVFVLLAAAFGTVRLAFLAFFTLPSALVGGAIAALLDGGVVTLGALVGFFTIFGIAARNGIMLINHYQHLEQYEGETFGPELAVRGARERLAPILMTALATGLALLPIAVSGPIPGHEIEYPMALVILGGLITSTLLNLMIMPVLYLQFGRRRRARASSIPDFDGQAVAG